MNTGSSLGYMALTLAAGIGIPVMAAMNASLGQRLGSAPGAAALLLFVACAAAVLVMLMQGGVSRPVLGVAPVPYYFAGFAVTFYILVITWAAPRFGVGNAVFFVLFGQLIAASLIDHFGLFGVQQLSLNPSRALGLVFMLAGIVLVRRPPVGP